MAFMVVLICGFIVFEIVHVTTHGRMPLHMCVPYTH